MPNFTNVINNLNFYILLNQVKHMSFSTFFCIKYANNYLDLEGIIMKGLISKRLLLIYKVSSLIKNRFRNKKNNAVFSGNNKCLQGEM